MNLNRTPPLHQNYSLRLPPTRSSMVRDQTVTNRDNSRAVRNVHAHSDVSTIVQNALRTREELMEGLRQRTLQSCLGMLLLHQRLQQSGAEGLTGSAAANPGINPAPVSATPEPAAGQRLDIIVRLGALIQALPESYHPDGAPVLTRPVTTPPESEAQQVQVVPQIQEPGYLAPIPPASHGPDMQVVPDLSQGLPEDEVLQIYA